MLGQAIQKPSSGPVKNGALTSGSAEEERHRLRLRKRRHSQLQETIRGPLDELPLSHLQGRALTKGDVLVKGKVVRREAGVKRSVPPKRSAGALLATADLAHFDIVHEARLNVLCWRS